MSYRPLIKRISTCNPYDRYCRKGLALLKHGKMHWHQSRPLKQGRMSEAVGRDGVRMCRSDPRLVNYKSMNEVHYNEY